MAPFAHLPLLPKKLTPFLSVRNRETKNTSPLRILWTLMPPITPLLTVTLVRTWYEESTPWDDKVG